MTPFAVIDLEISSPVPPQAELHRYAGVHVLIRLHGRPVGLVTAPIANGLLDLDHVYRRLLEHGGVLAPPLAARALALGRPPSWPDVGALLECRPNTLSCTPRVTVVTQSVDAIGGLEYPNLDVRPSDEGHGDIVVFVPDGVILDRGWVGAAVRVFIADPEVTAVTGLMLPRDAGARLEPVLERRWHRTALPAGPPGPIAVWRHAADAASGFSRGTDHTIVYEPAALAWHRTRLGSDPITMTDKAPAVPVLRRVDLGDTPRSIANATQEAAVRLDVSWESQPIGQVDIRHEGAILSPFRIHDAIAQGLAAEVLDTRLQLGPAAVHAIVTSELARHLVSIRGRHARPTACPQWIAPRPAAA